MGFMSRMRGTLMGKPKDSPAKRGAEGASSAEATRAEQDAAAKIQSRIRGNKARKNMGIGKMLYTPVAYIMDAGEEIIKAGGELVSSVVASRKPPPPTDAEVQAATPEGMWFTPREGWKSRSLGTTPHYMMPTAVDMDALFPADADVIGELRVEILEAAGLPNKDAVMGVSAGNLTDSYALLVFEGCAARTSVIFDSLNPRWAATDLESYRAFTFPVTRPYSVLYVSMFDFDGTKKQALRKSGDTSLLGAKRSGLDPDDPIGRVGIQLGRLVASTQYDLWLDLGYGAIEKPNGKLGRVRVRLSVTFPSERKRMVGYLKASATPIIPCNTKAYRKNALFAKRGKGAKDSYDWNVLMVYVDDLKTMIRLFITFVAVIEDILLWRRRGALTSAALCIGVQFLISRPSYIPASWGVAALAFLHRTYAQRSDDPRQDLPIHARTSFRELLMALAFDIAPKPLTATPLTVVLATSEPATESASKQPPQPLPTPRAATEGAGEDPARASARASAFEKAANAPGYFSAENAMAYIKKDLKSHAETYWHKKILGESEDDEIKVSKELAEEKARIGEQVAAFIDDGDDSVEEKIVKMREAQRQREDLSLMGKMALSVNPVAAALGPVQSQLAALVVPLRMVRYTLVWQDRILTLWLYLAILLMTLVLALIPWGLLVYYGSRLICFALLGPHMHFVGRKVDQMRREARQELKEYREADEDGKAAILERYKATLMKTGQEQVKQAQLKIAGKSKRELERLRFLEGQKYNFINGNTRANARIKYVATADPSRSSAQPIAKKRCG